MLQLPTPNANFNHEGQPHFQNLHFHFTFFFWSSVRQSTKSSPSTTKRPNAIIERSFTLQEPLKSSPPEPPAAWPDSRRKGSPIRLPRKNGGSTKVLRTRARPAAVKSAVVERGSSEYSRMKMNDATPLSLRRLPR